MSKLSTAQRRAALLAYLKTAHLPVSLSVLSDRYQTSFKTLRRDVEKFATEQNAPWFISNNKIYKDQSRPQTVELKSFWFEKTELESLFVLNQIIEQLSPGTLKTQLMPFKARLNDWLQTDTGQNPLSERVRIIEIAARNVEEPVFQTVSQALAENKRLHIRFWNRTTNETLWREISPQTLIRYRDNWLLDAYCHLRNQLRTFSLEAMLDITLMSKDAMIVSKTKLKDYFQSSYGIYAGKANKVAKIQFSPKAARWLQHENWHPEQIGQWQLDGSYVLSFPFRHDQELVNDLLQYGADIDILSPTSLRTSFQKTVQQLCRKFSGTSFDPDPCYVENSDKSLSDSDSE